MQRFNLNYIIDSDKDYKNITEAYVCHNCGCDTRDWGVYTKSSKVFNYDNITNNFNFNEYRSYDRVYCDNCDSYLYTIRKEMPILN